MGSMIAMIDVTAAKASSRKNNAPNTAPPGMLTKAVGRVLKIRPGPSAGSRPLANTIGKIISPASSAISVSAPAMMTADRVSDTSFGT